MVFTVVSGILSNHMGNRVEGSQPMQVLWQFKFPVLFFYNRRMITISVAGQHGLPISLSWAGKVSTINVSYVQERGAGRAFMRLFGLHGASHDIKHPHLMACWVSSTRSVHCVAGLVPDIVILLIGMVQLVCFHCFLAVFSCYRESHGDSIYVHVYICVCRCVCIYMYIIYVYTYI